MLKAKRSQAALEFLMTYGWAILVVLIVISALAYFGVPNPQTLLPTRCSMPTGFGCQDYVAKKTADTVTLAITNGMGNAIKISSITLTGQGAAAASTCDYNPAVPPASGGPYNITIANGGQTTLSFNTCDFAGLAGGNQKYRWTINIQYFAADSTDAFTKTLQGELFTTLEP